MKKIISFFLFFIIGGSVFGQAKKISDSLQKELSIVKTDTGRIMLLQWLAFYNLNNDSTFFYVHQAEKLLEKVNYPRGKILVYRTLGVAYERNGNSPMALKSYLTVLEAAEKIKVPNLSSMACIRLATLFITLHDYKSVEYYLNKTKQLVNYEIASTDYPNRCFGLLSIGECYLSIDNTDSALKYVQQAYEIALSRKIYNRLIASLGTLGDIHQQIGNDGLAMEYYRMFQKEALKQGRMKSDFKNGMAKLFLKQGNTDSALYYIRLSIKKDSENKNIELLSGDYFLLSGIFDKKNNTDSAYYYTKLAAYIKDSIFSKEKEQQIQNLSFNEQQRQQDIAAKKEIETRERKDYIEYALLALGIITFVILFLLLSRSFITSEKVIRFFGVIALLIVFEFLNLLLHPFLEKVTHHSPVLMLLALVCIAALLVPAHHQLEKWMTHTMVQKNKKIRLAAAKKTIESLEG